MKQELVWLHLIAKSLSQSGRIYIYQSHNKFIQIFLMCYPHYFCVLMTTRRKNRLSYILSLNVYRIAYHTSLKVSFNQRKFHHRGSSSIDQKFSICYAYQCWEVVGYWLKWLHSLYASCLAITTASNVQLAHSLVGLKSTIGLLYQQECFKDDIPSGTFRLVLICLYRYRVLPALMLNYCDRRAIYEFQ